MIFTRPFVTVFSTAKEEVILKGFRAPLVGKPVQELEVQVGPAGEGAIRTNQIFGVGLSKTTVSRLSSQAGRYLPFCSGHFFRKKTAASAQIPTLPTSPARSNPRTRRRGRKAKSPPGLDYPRGSQIDGSAHFSLDLFGCRQVMAGPGSLWRSYPPIRPVSFTPKADSCKVAAGRLS